MSPIEWAIVPLEKYATFSGRAPRAEYWSFALGSAIVGSVLAFVDKGMSYELFAGFGPFRLAFTILVMLPTFAVTVRRLHDTDTPGWWVFARVSSYSYLLVPLLHQDRTSFEQMSGWVIAGLVMLGIGWVCAEISLLVFLFISGTHGSNRYGPDPYGPNELEEVFA